MVLFNPHLSFEVRYYTLKTKTRAIINPVIYNTLPGYYIQTALMFVYFKL